MWCQITNKTQYLQILTLVEANIKRWPVTQISAIAVRDLQVRFELKGGNKRIHQVYTFPG